MIRNDYLLRSIEKLAAAIANLIAERGKTPPAESRREIENHLAEVFNTRRELLFSQEFEPQALDPRVCAQLGRYLALHAELSLELGDTDGSCFSAMWALAALRRGLDQGLTSSALQTERALTDFLRDDVMRTIPSRERADSYIELFNFAVEHNRIPQAEDAFFAAMDLTPSVELAERARVYFESLGSREPEELQAQGMVREEIDAILVEIDGFATTA